VDISAPDFDERIVSVVNILKTLGLERKKMIIVFNKTDRIDGTIIPNVEKRYDAVSISCRKEEGIERLVGKIESVLAGETSSPA
jgi:50S ribosomal subunit-associated GTPase HflX